MARKTLDAVGIAAFLFRPCGDDFELLLLCRAGGGFEGAWTPVAGRLDPGEPTDAAAFREIFEETGLTPGLYRTAHVVEHETGPDGALGLIEVFVGFVARDAPVVLNYEHSDYRWDRLAEAPVPTDRHRELLAAIEQEFLRGDPPSELRIRAAS